MKITLITDYKGLETYLNTFQPFLAAGKYAGKGSDFIHEIQLDEDDIHISRGVGSAVGHVTVRRKSANSRDEY